MEALAQFFWLQYSTLQSTSENWTSQLTGLLLLQKIEWLVLVIMSSFQMVENGPLNTRLVQFLDVECKFCCQVG
jgi:hypothetical protein